MNRFTPAEDCRLRNISQEDMADTLGLGITAYRQKERGEKRFYKDEAERFALAVNMPETLILFTSDVSQK